MRHVASTSPASEGSRVVTSGPKDASHRRSGRLRFGPARRWVARRPQSAFEDSARNQVRFAWTVSAVDGATIKQRFNTENTENHGGSRRKNESRAKRIDFGQMTSDAKILAKYYCGARLPRANTRRRSAFLVSPCTFVILSVLRVRILTSSQRNHQRLPRTDLCEDRLA